MACGSFSWWSLGKRKEIKSRKEIRAESHWKETVWSIAII